MLYRIDSMLEPATFSDKRDALWRVAFGGGPLDGAVARSASLPSAALELPSVECAGGQSPNSPAPVARYQFRASRVRSPASSPIVTLHYQYRGSVAGSSDVPLWRRALAALARFFSRR